MAKAKKSEEKEVLPKSVKEAPKKVSDKEAKKEIVLIKVFDKKSNRQRELTQEEIDIEPTRYSLR